MLGRIRQVEVLVLLDQRVDQHQGRGDVDVLVHLAVDQEELALQTSGQGLVRLLSVVLLDRQ